MAQMRKFSAHLLAVALILLLALCVSSLPVYRPHHHSHSLKRRSHPPPKPPLLLPDDEESLLINLDDPQTRAELSHRGVKKLIVDEDGADEDGAGEVVEQTLLDEEEEDEESYSRRLFQFHQEVTREDEVEEELKQSKTFNEEFPKKFVQTNSEKKETGFKPESTKTEFTEDHLEFSTEDVEEEEVETTTASPKDSKEPSYPPTEPTVPSLHSSTKRKSYGGGRFDPLVLPVTTEGKTNAKPKVDEPLKVYGFPKELLPIVPGGGSRFEDVEREKLEKKKMSQTKGVDDDSSESGGSHEAEGLYSSASLTSMSLVFYCLASFLLLDRISL